MPDLDRVGARVLRAPRSSDGVHAREPARHVRDERPAPGVTARAQRRLEVRHPSTLQRGHGPCRGPCRRGPRGTTSTFEPVGSGRVSSQPITCDGSSAGRMPSVLASAWNPSSASVVGGRDVLREPRVLAGRRARGRRPGSRGPAEIECVVDDLAVRVLQQVAERAVQDAGLALRERRAVLARAASRARRPRRRSAGRAGDADERGEHADRVAPAADARDHDVGIAAQRAPRTARAPRRRSPAGGRAPAPGTDAGPTTEPMM